MDTKEILGRIRASENNELQKHNLALKVFDELDRMLPHFNIEEILDEEMDEESLRVKKRYDELTETWRKGGTVELGKREETVPKDGQKIPNTNRPYEDEKLSGREVPPPKEPTEFEKLKEEWGMGKAKLIIMRLEEKGIITANGDVYDWKIDTEHGYGYNLYAYFVYHASIKLDWMEGKKKDRVPWRKFNPMFPNVSNNQNSRNNDLVCIRQNLSCPSKATIIDEVLDW